MGFPSSFSFLGIGIPEVMLIIILALVVLGPERLPGVAKEIIKGFFRLRNLSKELTGQLEQELGVEELKELKDLKDVKTGELVKKWANDELDINLDGEKEEENDDAKEPDTRAAARSSSKAKPDKPTPASVPAASQKAVATPPSAQTSPNGRNKVEVGSLIDSGVSSPAGHNTVPVPPVTTPAPATPEIAIETVAVENQIAPPVAAGSVADAVATEATIAVNGAMNGMHPNSAPYTLPQGGMQGSPKAALTRAWPSPNRTALRHPLAPIRMSQSKGLRGRLLFTRWR